IYPYSKTFKEKMSNITLYEELYDAQLDLREERRIQIEEVYVESIKCLERIIEEKDIIIQDTVNQYEKISQNTISHNDNRFSECDSNDSGYNSYDEYEEIMQDIFEVISEDSF
ncbi:30566_t:CDS:2, partial [Racocetra persica]